jgi:deoxyhypusine synthase
VYADATLVFPLVVAATFGKAHWAEQAKAKEQENGVVAADEQ